MDQPAAYDRRQSYDWNYQNVPQPPQEIEVAEVPGSWQFCGIPVDSPLGIPAGPLLNGRWCLYYASLGFDVLTYKTVRSSARPCYPLPNLQPVQVEALHGGEGQLLAIDSMQGSWAVSFGMPSQPPDVWRADIEWTRRQLPAGKCLSVSVVGTTQEGWSLEQLADDYARCARWAVDSGADVIETNFSCPNVSTCDGQLFQNPSDAAAVAARVRQEVGPDVPYVAKIGRIVATDQATELIDALAPHLDALAMTNSIAATVRTDDGSRLFDGQPRGICGVATRAASTQQTATFHELIEQRENDLQLIGVGGATSLEDVQSYLQAGAHAVHLATAAMLDPQVGLRIRRQWNASPTLANPSSSAASLPD